MKYEKSPRPLIRGACCAVVTPFSNGNIDLDAFTRLIRRVTNGGIDSLVVCGTTGESSTLTDEEQKTLIRCAVDAAPNATVLCGASSNSTFHAALRAKNAIECGAAGCLCVTPYYNKTSEDGMVEHYRRIADAAAEAGNAARGIAAPIILYNVPSRTGSALTYSILERLAATENIVGIKEASGDLRFTTGIFARFGDRYEVYSGCDELSQPIMAAGGAGCISVAANVFPAEIAAMCEAQLAGDSVRASSIANAMRCAVDAMFCEVNPIPVKAMLAELGIAGEELRLPLCPLSSERRREVVCAMGRAAENLAAL